MRSLILLIIWISFSNDIFPQDSLKIIKKNKKWNLSFAIDNNINFRYVRVPEGKDNGVDKMNYLDSCNIACSMKSLSIRLERKIWRFIGLQSGFTYGQKGYVGCRDITYGDFGIKRAYYTNMPFFSFSLPVGLIFNKELFNKRLILSLNTGIEFNYVLNKPEYTFKMSLEKSGFFGSKYLNDVNGNLPYENHQQGIIVPAQYYAGLNIKFLIFEDLFLRLGYNYISDFRFYKVSEYLDVRTYVYERKSYIHRYGVGLGFRF
jgi:hypothetical protein